MLPLGFRTQVKRHLGRFRHLGEQAQDQTKLGEGLFVVDGWQDE